MKELEREAIKDLLEFYSMYVEKGNNLLVKKKAQEVEGKYLTAGPLLNEFINLCVSKLVSFYAKIGIEPISKEEAKEIIKRLEKTKGL